MSRLEDFNPELLGRLPKEIRDVSSYTVEYRMDPSRLKGTVNMILTKKTGCSQIIRKILELQLEYDEKCQNAKDHMESEIVKLLLSDKAKKILT